MTRLCTIVDAVGRNSVLVLWLVLVLRLACRGSDTQQVVGLLVFKVQVEDSGDGYEVTCPTVPALRQRVRDVWDACSVRPVLAERAKVPNDLVWLQIRAKTGPISVISDVHPSHWVALHTVTRPSHPVFDRSTAVFDHALAALRHEANLALKQGRDHAQVKFILSFVDGTKVSLPRTGGYRIRDLLEELSDAGDLGAWAREKLVGSATGGHWYTPVVGVQVGVFGPDVGSPQRFR
jgi:hypothetical protein